MFKIERCYFHSTSLQKHSLFIFLFQEYPSKYTTLPNSPRQRLLHHCLRQQHKNRFRGDETVAHGTNNPSWLGGCGDGKKNESINQSDRVLWGFRLLQGNSNSVRWGHVVAVAVTERRIINRSIIASVYNFFLKYPRN